MNWRRSDMWCRMPDIDHLALAKQFASTNGLSVQLAIANALIAIAERLPAATRMLPEQMHHNYSSEQM